MLKNPIVIKKTAGSRVISLLDTGEISTLSSNTDVIYLYADYSTSSVVKVGFLLANGVEVPYRPIFESDEVVTSVVPEADIEEDYVLWEYAIPSAVLANLAQKGALQTILAFKNTEITDDTDYLGIFTTANELDATINTELKAEYTSAATGEWANVYQTTSNTFFSWLFDGTDFIKQTSILNEQMLDYTLPLGLAINQTVSSTDEEIDVTVTEIILDELAEITQVINGITGDISNLMLKSDYAEETSEESVRYARNVGELGASKPASEIIAGIFPEIDLNEGGTGGKITWSETEQTTERVINSNVTLQDGREILKLGRNASGATIDDLKPIAIIGSIGQTAEIELVDITDAEQSFKTIGVTTEQILNNSTGNINTIGRVRGNFSFTEGADIYVGVGGILTETKPTPPNRCIRIGVLEKTGGDGILYVNPVILPNVDELSDVDMTSVAENDVIVYESGLYKPSSRLTDVENANLVKTITYTSGTGTFTITYYDDTTTQINTALETIIESGYYDATENDIVLVLADSSEIRIPADDLLTDLDASNVRYDGSTGFIGKTNVQDALDQAKQDIDDIVLGGLADDSVTNAKLGIDVKIGSLALLETTIKSDVVSAVNEIANKTDKSQSTQSNNARINSTYGAIEPIEGSPSLDLVEGLSLNQLVLNGNFASGTTGWSNYIDGSLSVSSNVMQVTGLGGSTTMGAYNLLTKKGISGVNYYVKGSLEVDTTASSIEILFRDGTGGTVLKTISIVSPTINTSYDLNVLTGALASTTTNNISIICRAIFADSATQNGAILKIKDVKAIPLTNTPLSTLTASEINGIITEYFEGVQDAVPSITTIGKNLFDLFNETYTPKDASIEYNIVDNNTLKATVVTAGTFDYVQVTKTVKPNTDYYFKADSTRTTTAGGGIIILASGSGATLLSAGANLNPSGTFTSESDGEIILRFYPNYNVSESGSAEWTNIQLEQGTTATTYAEHKTDTITLDTTLRSVGDIRDKAYVKDNEWVKESLVGVDFNDVVQSVPSWTVANALTNTQQFYEPLSSTLGYKLPPIDTSKGNVSLRVGNDVYTVTPRSTQNSADVENTVAIGVDGLLTIRVNKTTYPNTASFEAYLQANDVTFYYELDTPTIEVIDSDGGLIQENPTTIIQNNTLPTAYDMTFNLDDSAQIGTNTDNIGNLNKQVEQLEDRVDTAESNITTLQDDVTVLEGKRTLITSGVQVISSATTKPANNISTTQAITDFDELEIYVQDDNFSDNKETKFTWIVGDTQVKVFSASRQQTSSELSLWAFTLDNDTTTAFSAYYARNYPIYGAPSALSNMYIIRIYGIKY